MSRKLRHKWIHDTFALYAQGSERKNHWDSPTFSHEKISSAHLSIKLHAGQAQNMKRKVPPLQKREKKKEKERTKRKGKQNKKMSD